jgi:hypothetical protein
VQLDGNELTPEAGIVRINVIQLRVQSSGCRLFRLSLENAQATTII